MAITNPGGADAQRGLPVRISLGDNLLLRSGFVARRDRHRLNDSASFFRSTLAAKRISANPFGMDLAGGGRRSWNCADQDRHASSAGAVAVCPYCAVRSWRTLSGNLVALFQRVVGPRRPPAR